ncbi:Imidazoleglycerol-phosphate dehydratase [Phytophthora nicotianae]|uniref:Imidazoleglycerol-phosphate dehydratase n=1 Tax=Phytophthora nicotianae TaxID=4792 RepID=A0A0W8CFH1_PHYNI|nr:Imidazoleglycerol-phosphate dehydratase [Phytophthora nicotianae]
MAEKARSAVASYFSSHENSDGTDVNKWSVSEDDTGSKREYGNPARDPFVRQFMRGLKKKKALEYVPARAVPISLQMLDVLHKFMVSAQDGFTEDCQMWFKAVSSFAFDGMCRINEVLTLKWKDVSLRQFRANVVAPDEIIEFGTYTHFNRKIEVEEGRSYNLHKLAGEETAMNAYEYLSNWVAYATEKRGHKWVDEDYVFPVLVGLSKKAIKSGKGSTGCEKVTVGWGKKMGEQSFINLLNCIVHSLNRKASRHQAMLRNSGTTAGLPRTPSVVRGSIPLHVRQASASMVVTND